MVMWPMFRPGRASPFAIQVNFAPEIDIASLATRRWESDCATPQYVEHDSIRIAIEELQTSFGYRQPKYSSQLSFVLR